MPAFKHITATTQSMVDDAQAIVDKKASVVFQKMEQLILDVKVAQKSKLSSSAVQSIKDALDEKKILWKHLTGQGVSDLLANQILTVEKSHEKINATLIKSIDALIAKGLNSTVHQEIKQLSKDIRQFEKKAQDIREKIEKFNPLLSKDIAVATRLGNLDMLVREQELFEVLNDRIQKIKVLSKDNLSVSNDFPLPRQRHALAKKCVTTSRSELSGAHGFVGDPDNMGMFAMYVSDAVNHYELGVELLAGNPQKIENASYMDTASREGIDEDVWTFVCTTLKDKSIFGPKAVKEHRQKVIEQQAKKFNRALHKEVGDVSSKPVSRSRKM